jgi:hypothetical protein
MSRLPETKNQKLRAAFLRLLAATGSRGQERKLDVRDLAPASPSQAASREAAESEAERERTDAARLEWTLRIMS